MPSIQSPHEYYNVDPSLDLGLEIRLRRARQQEEARKFERNKKITPINEDMEDIDRTLLYKKKRGEALAGITTEDARSKQEWDQRQRDWQYTNRKRDEDTAWDRRQRAWAESDRQRDQMWQDTLRKWQQEEQNRKRRLWRREDTRNFN